MRCRSLHRINLDSAGKTYIELVCDLDDHPGILGFHYDKLIELEWRDPLVPSGVPVTRKNPKKAGGVMLPQPSFSSETSEFEVLK
jgi:hypothetical protein